MIEIMGKMYMVEKEAALRYGYSAAWFRNKRYYNQGPPFLRLDCKGRKIFYELESTDDWFKEHFKINGIDRNNNL